MKIKVNQKVHIPKTKSVGDDIGICYVMKEVRKRNMPFLYITKIYKDRTPTVYVCDVTKYEGGDWFLEQDLVPYVESRDTLNKQLLNGEIDIVTYQSLLKEVT